jgi:hypothetical protein
VVEVICIVAFETIDQQRQTGVYCRHICWTVRSRNVLNQCLQGHYGLITIDLSGVIFTHSQNTDTSLLKYTNLFANGVVHKIREVISELEKG